MASSLCLLHHIRALLHQPSKLNKTKAQIIDAERKAPSHIGSWRCICGHRNALYLRSLPALHPLGCLSCHACPLSWSSNISLDITSQTTGIRFPRTHDPAKPNDTPVLNSLSNSSTSYLYVCRGDESGCGLSWRTEIKTEWFSGQKRKVLLIDGKRGKCHCDCGMKIFQKGRYDVFGIV